MKKFLQGTIALVFVFSINILEAQSPGDWQFASAAGGTGADIARGLATDAIGNSYVTGSFSLTTTFYGATNVVLNSAGSTDVFTAKYDPQGNVLWAVAAGGKKSDQATGICTDYSGNTYVTGFFSDTAIFYGSVNIQLISNGNMDVFVAKFDPNGSVLWAKKAGGLGDDFGYKICCDLTGNTYLTGFFPNDTLVFYGLTNDSLHSNGANDIFLAKLDPNGNMVWAKNAGGSGNDNGYGIALDGSGNIYLTGAFLNTAYFYAASSTDSLISYGSNDIFIAKYSNNGDELWVRQGGSNLTDQGVSIALDASANSYVTGNLSANCTFYAPPSNISLPSNGSSDIFLTSFDSAGNIRWAKHAGGSGGDFARGINFTSGNHCSVTGYFQNTATFYGTPNISMTSIGSADIFVAEYDTAGNILCGQQAGGSGFDVGWDVGSDAAGNSFVAGQFAGTATFQSTPTFTLTASGTSSDIVLAKWLSGCSGLTAISVYEKEAFLYPNPAVNNVTIRYRNAATNDLKVTLHDVYGRIISQQTLSLENGETRFSTDLVTGVYFVTIKAANEKPFTQKLIIAK